MRRIPPNHGYSYRNESEFRDEARREINSKQNIGEPIILRSPNGSRFRVSIDDNGQLSAEALNVPTSI